MSVLWIVIPLLLVATAMLWVAIEERDTESEPIVFFGDAVAQGVRAGLREPLRKHFEKTEQIVIQAQREAYQATDQLAVALDVIRRVDAGRLTARNAAEWVEENYGEWLAGRTEDKQ